MREIYVMQKSELESLARDYARVYTDLMDRGEVAYPRYICICADDQGFLWVDEAFGRYPSDAVALIKRLDVRPVWEESQTWEEYLEVWGHEVQEMILDAERI